MNRVRIVIFAKAPHPGFAKTRLIPALGEKGAADLARTMLRHTVSEALQAKVDIVELCCAPASDPLWDALDLPEALIRTDQGEGSLGERMARASARVIAGAESILLIGTDCPALNAPRLREMALALRNVDAVITPALDGGYVALGLNRFDARLFQGIAWSTDTVASATRARLARLAWSVRQYPPQRDIDEPDDLHDLPASWRSVSGSHPAGSGD